MGIEGKLDFTLDPDNIAKHKQEAKLKNAEEETERLKSESAKLKKNIDMLGEQVSRFSIDAKTGLLSGEILVPKLNELIKKLNFVGDKNTEAIPDKIMVIALDMNGLKFLNDNYGHVEGDNALIAFANGLRKVIKDTDLIFRPKGADEFTVLLQIFKKNIDPKEIFKRIKNAVNNDIIIKIEGENFKITVSVGYSILNKGEAKTAEQLLHEADLMEREDNKRQKQV